MSACKDRWVKFPLSKRTGSPVVACLFEVNCFKYCKWYMELYAHYYNYVQQMSQNGKTVDEIRATLPEVFDKLFKEIHRQRWIYSVFESCKYKECVSCFERFKEFCLSRYNGDLSTENAPKLVEFMRYSCTTVRPRGSRPCAEYNRYRYVFFACIL